MTKTPSVTSRAAHFEAQLDAQRHFQLDAQRHFGGRPTSTPSVALKHFKPKAQLDAQRHFEGGPTLKPSSTPSVT